MANNQRLHAAETTVTTVPSAPTPKVLGGMTESLVRIGFLKPFVAQHHLPIPALLLTGLLLLELESWVHLNQRQGSVLARCAQPYQSKLFSFVSGAAHSVTPHLFLRYSAMWSSVPRFLRPYVVR